MAASTFGVIMALVVMRFGLAPAMIVHFLVNIVILSAWSAAGPVLVPVIAVSLLGLAAVWVHHVFGSWVEERVRPTA